MLDELTTDERRFLTITLDALLAVDDDTSDAMLDAQMKEWTGTDDWGVQDARVHATAESLRAKLN